MGLSPASPPDWWQRRQLLLVGMWARPIAMSGCGDADADAPAWAPWASGCDLQDVQSAAVRRIATTTKLATMRTRIQRSSVTFMTKHLSVARTRERTGIR